MATVTNRSIAGLCRFRCGCRFRRGWIRGIPAFQGDFDVALLWGFRLWLSGGNILKDCAEAPESNDGEFDFVSDAELFEVSDPYAYYGINEKKGSE